MPDIIIVEDNIEIGTLLCDFIRKKNYTVSHAETGEKALDIFERYGANLIVLDIGLPRSGWLFCLCQNTGDFQYPYSHCKCQDR